MGQLLAFLFEQSIINSFALFGAAGLAAYVAGPFLVIVGAGIAARVSVYTTLGVVAGLLSYSLGVKDRSMKAWEIVAMTIAMAILAFPVIYLFAYVRARRQSSR